MAAELRRELARLGAAAALLTRVPVPASPHEPDWLPRSAKYFPLVGIAIGIAGAAVLAGAATLWPRPIPDLLAAAALLLLTGALHEDGLADTFDSFGGRTREARLAILKDSRLGTYGALALVAALALRVASLAALPVEDAALALVGAAAGGRFAAALLLALQPYAGDPATAKLAAAPDRPRPGELALAAALGLGPALLVGPAGAAAAMLGGGVAAAVLASRACRLLGGQTGDVLGAAVVAYEIGFLLGAVASLAG